MKLSARTLIILGSVALQAGLSSGVARAAPPLESEAETAESVKTEAAAPETQGLFELIGQALKDVNLREDQKTAAQELGGQVAAKQQAVDAARTELVLALADELAEGRVNHAALKAKTDALVAARQAESPVMRKSLTSLHQLMTPEQRTAFVASLEKHIQTVRAETTPAATLEQWSKDLALNAEQKQEIKAMLDKAAEKLTADRDNAKHMLDAFGTGTFDPEKIVPERDAQARAKERVTNLVAMTETLAHVLTPDQRAKAAAKLRATFGATAIPVPAGSHEKSLEGAGPDGQINSDEIGATEDPVVVAHGRTAVAGGWGYGARGVSRGVAVSSRSYGAAFSGGGMIL